MFSYNSIDLLMMVISFHLTRKLSTYSVLFMIVISFQVIAISRRKGTNRCLDVYCIMLYLYFLLFRF